MHSRMRTAENMFPTKFPKSRKYTLVDMKNVGTEKKNYFSPENRRKHVPQKFPMSRRYTVVDMKNVGTENNYF